jgi:hypothetical protein
MTSFVRIAVFSLKGHIQEERGQESRSPSQKEEERADQYRHRCADEERGDDREKQEEAQIL